MSGVIADERVAQPIAHPDLGDITRVFARIGVLSFGGPAGQIALMHKVVVDERRWLSEARFLHALNYCMLLPGPEAQQLATYIGWLLHGWRGGVIAGLLFILPGFAVIMALSTLYALFGQSNLLGAVFFGLKAAVLAIVIEAVIKVGRRALKTRFALVLAAAAFVAIFLFDLPFPLVVAGAAVAGLAVSRWRPGWLVAGGHGGGAKADDAVYLDLPARAAEPGWGRAARLLALWGAIWAAPALALALLLGPGIFDDIALFFARMAVVTFGGAYAVLAYVGQAAVADFGWLKPGEMLDGLALAETTPGPLILVLTFVGFLAAFRAPMGLDPLTAGLIGGALATWVTFAPCFLWIFLGAPHVERLRQNRALAAALSAITAAVVGVILNLAIWFGINVLFARVAERTVGPLRLLVPDVASLDWMAVALFALACVALFRLRLGVPATLALCAACGLGLKLGLA
ncbi:MAG: chromate efflux transporter [Hyphomicrobiaceae bacterium]|nr:chromate efflux transporter [Hyphomicrobiaceae bacterium]